MAISRGKELLSQLNPDRTEISKSIAALKQEASYVQKCINANLRDRASGNAVIEEIEDLVTKLKEKL